MLLVQWSDNHRQQIDQVEQRLHLQVQYQWSLSGTLAYIKSR